MSKQNQKPQKMLVNPAATPVTTNVDDRTKINQMRQNLKNEIEELRRQVLLVQQQSLKVMQNGVPNIFKTQTNEPSAQMAPTGTVMQKQLKKGTKALKSATAGSTKNTNKTSSNAERLQAKYAIALQAIQAAQQSIDHAMKAVKKAATDAENILKKS